MFVIIFEIIGILAGVIKYLFLGNVRGINVLLTDMLYCQLVVSAFISGVFGFIGHYFKADYVAEFIGWPKGNPFQKEIAFTNLAIGLTSFLAAFNDNGYWLACIVFISIFYLGAAMGHVQDMKAKGNMNQGNAFMVVPDILMPCIMIALYIAVYFV